MKAYGKRKLMLMTVFALAALLLVAATVFATRGDYGVNSGASASSTCGGTSGPSCTISYNGHPASYSATNNDGSYSYQFDDYDCTAVVSPTGSVTIGGEECGGVNSTPTPAPTETPEPDPEN